MSMDEREKKELVKKIMEQREALWKKKGKASQKNKPLSQFHQENIVKMPTKADSTDNSTEHEIPVEIVHENDNGIYDEGSSEKKERFFLRFFLMSELKKAEELGLKVIIAVICILVSALVLGAFIGYGITVLNF